MPGRKETEAMSGRRVMPAPKDYRDLREFLEASVLQAMLVHAAQQVRQVPLGIMGQLVPLEPPAPLAPRVILASQVRQVLLARLDRPARLELRVA